MGSCVLCFSSFESLFPPNVVSARSHSRESSQSRSTRDALPPFATLTNDDDREKKAESQDPGTFNVIVNPDSFLGLPEYSDSGSPAPLEISAARHDAGQRINHTNLEARPYRDQVRDPNIVVLRKFEDSGKRLSTLPWQSQSQPKSSKSSVSPLLSSAGVSRHTDDLEVSDESRSDRSMIEIARRGGKDAKLLEHYRGFVWRQVIQIHRHRVSRPAGAGVNADVDAFEEEAGTFPPLYHAMMALSALSLANLAGVQNSDSLEHYEQALPSLKSSLRSSQDLCSDGALFTHFFLLLYEVRISQIPPLSEQSTHTWLKIASAEQWGSNLWSQHLSQLCRITSMRREMFSSERHPFLVWWIFIIDMYASLSGSGEGEFIDTALKRDLIPPLHEQLPPLGIEGSNNYYPEEREVFPAVLSLNRKMILLAARLGGLARGLRISVAQGLPGNASLSESVEMTAINRRGQVNEIQWAFRRLWTEESRNCLPEDWIHTDRRLPTRVQGVFEHAYALYRACMIYSHTSMWTSQRRETSPGADEEIAQYVVEIIQLAESIINSGRMELRFIVFALFMAGFASPSDRQSQTKAVSLIGAVEQESIGRITTTTRQLLQAVYDRQGEDTRAIGHCWDVDWMEIMNERGLQVVNFGL
ncbi:MAG: hypothetical protein M1812_004688 [Candelaria pacifica]|nr:MAG: hypothetical protein M1812_004688 [Candelaria pacifica]